jgi:hypothetical protein
VIRYNEAPPPQDVVTFHGPQFGVPQAEYDALKAELFQAKAIAEHWQKRTEQTEKERAEFRDDAKRLRAEIDQCDNAEASVCPEDVGVVEYVKTLKAEVAKLQADLAACDLTCREEVSALRTLLKEVYRKNYSPATCTHSPDCVGCRIKAVLGDERIFPEKPNPHDGGEPVVPSCAHNWVWADNEHVIHAMICTKCAAFRAPDGRLTS